MKEKPAIINLIWLWLIFTAIAVGMANGAMQEVTDASFSAAKNSVELAIKLIGVMALWLGLMKIAEDAGLMQIIAKGIRPIMVRLFPDVPSDHPAMGAMIMNIAANMLGLGNAATPLGIKAMIELNKLAPRQGEATNAMCLFLAINTSSVTLLPLGVIGVRAAAGATDPASIILPGLVATMTSTAVGIAAAKLMARRTADVILDDSARQIDGTAESAAISTSEISVELQPPDGFARFAVWLFLAALVAIVGYRIFNTPFIELREEMFRYWIVPIIMLAIIIFGYLRGVKVYEAATEGAKEGFNVAVRIIPFLVVILVAIGMFKASGAFALFSNLLNPITSFLGMPGDVLPMALMRPLSGSGAFGVMSEIVQQSPNSLSAYMASIMQGSTETTFYVLAVYFGAVGITKARHAVPAALIADAAGIAMAILMARWTFGG